MEFIGCQIIGDHKVVFVYWTSHSMSLFNITECNIVNAEKMFPENP